MPDSYSEWKADVQHGRTVLGFIDWLYARRPPEIRSRWWWRILPKPDVERHT